jgi:hypothetical protein
MTCDLPADNNMLHYKGGATGFTMCTKQAPRAQSGFYSPFGSLFTWCSLCYKTTIVIP